MVEEIKRPEQPPIYEPNCDLEYMRKNFRVWLGGPVYGGMAHPNYRMSVEKLILKLFEQEITFDHYEIPHDALITRARNTWTNMGLQDPRNFTHFLFIDGDIGFQADQIFHMLWIACKHPEFPIIGAAYPRKSYDWENIWWAAKMGVPVNRIHEFGAQFVLNAESVPVEGKDRVIQLWEPSEIDELGTGMMLISRRCLDGLKKHTEKYKPDHMPFREFQKSNLWYWNYFQAPVDKRTHRLLSEDYFFTQHAKKHGFKTFVCPWIELSHRGPHEYTGALANLVMFLDAKRRVRLAMEVENAKQRGNAQVEDGQAAQRQQEGPEGDQPESGDRHHDERARQ